MVNSGDLPTQFLFTPRMPQEELAHLQSCYHDANVILEYGSGNSTLIAASMHGKFIMSVESDEAWSQDVRRKLLFSAPRSAAVIYYANIGPTGAWGRPRDEGAWRHYHTYPNAIWDEPWFQQPDVVLIDGRFRTGCFASVLLHTQKPVRVLFDDYSDRPRYQVIENIVKPTRIIGRMADFQINPGMVNTDHIGFLLKQYFQVSPYNSTAEYYHDTSTF